MRSIEVAGLSIGDEYPTRIMGVLNVSEESPYDPSVRVEPAAAATRIDAMIDVGADIIDVGLASANKRFDVLAMDEELERLEIAAKAIEATTADAVFSIETRYPPVADEALSRGFDMVNDIAGFAAPQMPIVCSDHEAPVIKMASPPDITRPGAVEETPWTERKSREWVERAEYVDMVYEALRQNGLPDECILDPAFGGWSAAKSLADDRETFRRLREFRGLNRPILVSINRKNFLKAIVDRETKDALPASLAATAMAVERGAHVIRTHDVAETLDAARIGDAFTDYSSKAEPVATDTEACDIRELSIRTLGEAERQLERIGADVELATSAVAKAYELEGLEPAERAKLAGLAESAGARLAVGTESAILLGTCAAYDRIAADATSESAGLETVVAAIRSQNG